MSAHGRKVLLSHLSVLLCSLQLALHAFRIADSASSRASGDGNGRIHIEYYSIDGATIEELRAELQSKGPLDPFGRQRHAVAEWRVEWNWPRDQFGEALLAETTSRFAVTIRLPRWNRPPGAAPMVEAEWRRYFAALVRHELKHAEPVIEETPNVAWEIRRLAAMNREATVADAHGVANRIMRKLRSGDRRLDMLTDHGRRDGAQLGGRTNEEN